MNHIVDRNPDQDAEANQPVLSDAERAALIGSLDAAYRRMEAGDYAVLIPGTLATMMEPYLAPATPHRQRPMPQTLRIGRGALDDIAALAVWLTETAGEATARRHLARLDNDLTGAILRGPNRFGWFRETGPPYRAKLFRLARTTYWIVYRIDDANGIVSVLRLWNSAREPGTHGLADEPSDRQ